MEGISRLLTKFHANGYLGGVKISEVSYLSHLFLVDDVLIFLDSSICDTTCLKNILFLFSKYIGMEPKFNKSPYFWCQAYRMRKYMPYIIFKLSVNKCRQNSTTFNSGSRKMVIVL